MSQPVKLSECLETVDTPEGKERVANYLETQPYPHYEPARLIGSGFEFRSPQLAAASKQTLSHTETSS